MNSNLDTGKEALANFNEAVQKEWLETNGLGGWAASSITGCHTRSYHGLLVAATEPPAGRFNLLSKLDETIACDGKRFELAINDYGNGHLTGNPASLELFRKQLFPEWVFNTVGVRLRKTLAMLHGENSVIIRYEVLSADEPFQLELLPLVSAKNYHELQHNTEEIAWDVDFASGVFHNRPTSQSPDLYISVPGSSYRHEPQWFNHFHYRIDEYRGQESVEDLFGHGIISVNMKAGDVLAVLISTEPVDGRDALAMMNKERVRRMDLAGGDNDPAPRQLLRLAADQFIAAWGNNLKTIIAGYHWFADWGRDSMIALPGLCLATGRFADARDILSAFARKVDHGMLPNRFAENGQTPEYNTADGTLWFFIAVHQYLQATGDRDFVLKEILPVLKEVIDWHFRGTRYNIRVQGDGLLFAGETGQQLTWMDAKIGDWVVTPRMGKPVEIQALWYNALHIFSRLLTDNGQSEDGARVCEAAQKTQESFQSLFWNEEAACLYDTIDENGQPDASIRPNQLFAVSLPFALIDGQKAGAVVEMVTNRLYTPVGLRSLSPADPRYTPVYGGDAFHRDSAYHQGTVWSWLLGPYIDALVKVQGNTDAAKKVVRDFSDHLNQGCIGSVAEIFDADAPHHPRGCCAQAWSIGELLRVITTYQL